MQAVVVHPGTTSEALRSVASRGLLRSGIESVLLPSKTLTPAERIAIYQEMYPMRMRDALASDYPGIEHFLGDRFWDFVLAYTAKHPSMRYTLNRLGDHVPRFLARQRTFGPRAFLVDLARLELAITEAFDADERTALSLADLESIPADRLPQTILVPVPTLRLLSLEWNAGAYLDTVRDENHNHPKPRRARAFVTIVRRNYSVYRNEISESAYLVLKDLVAGKAIGQAVRRGLGRRGRSRAKPDEFGRWFQSWVSEGFFSVSKKTSKSVSKKGLTNGRQAQ